jgi:hypothetical protein
VRNDQHHADRHTKTPAPKPTNNFERLLRVLEANAASAHEPELIARLHEMLTRLRAATEEHNGRA